MALFSVEIADADVGRVLTALAANYHRPDQVENPDYPSMIPNPSFDNQQPVSPDNPAEIEDPAVPMLIDNPESVAVFGNRMVRQFLADNVTAYEVRVAKQAAAEAAAAAVVTINDPQV